MKQPPGTSARTAQCTGRSEPQAQIRISRTCSADASVPAINSTGSPGTSRTSTNTMLATTHQIGHHRHHPPQHITPSESRPGRLPVNNHERITEVGRGSGGGAGMRSPGPYLLGASSTTQTSISWRAKSGPAECDSSVVWGAQSPPPPPDPVRLAHSELTRPSSTRQPHVPEVVRSVDHAPRRRRSFCCTPRCTASCR